MIDPWYREDIVDESALNTDQVNWLINQEPRLHGCVREAVLADIREAHEKVFGQPVACDEYYVNSSLNLIMCPHNLQATANAFFLLRHAHDN